MQEKIMERVRKMLERANHPNTPDAEREVCLAKANSMMLKHAIDQAMLDKSDPGQKRVAESRKFRAFGETEWSEKFVTILDNMEGITRTRVMPWCQVRGEVHVFGMPDDLDYYEMLWNNIMFTFISRLHPKWDNNLSFEHNVYNFKRSGAKWIEIMDTARRNGCWVDWPDGGRLMRSYKRHAKIVGDTEVISTQRHAAFRESFAEGFVRAVCQRMEAQVAEGKKEAASSGAELVLVDVGDRVNEAFYNAYPHMRPRTQEERAAALAKYHADRQAELEAHEEWLASLSDKERRDYEREQEKKRRAEARANDRYWREQAKAQDRAYDSGGMSAGRSAGESVDLGGRGKVAGNSRGELG